MKFTFIWYVDQFVATHQWYRTISHWAYQRPVNNKNSFVTAINDKPEVAILKSNDSEKKYYNVAHNLRCLLQLLTHAISTRVMPLILDSFMYEIIVTTTTLHILPVLDADLARIDYIVYEIFV